uniref:NADH-ubiquinone oxidoreductase chain 5 n=1 Tax=Euborellia annulipes TaxID=146833 RepID=A0A343YVG1_9NEOP|nr:NADH dehydrogenase subunit 5 [Euborellia annulipes]
MLASMILGSVSIYCVNFNESFYLEWMLIKLNSMVLVMTIYLDMIAAMFMSVVMFISGLIMIYSVQYMSSDKFMNRFILIVFLFVLSMMFLIISPNLVSILLGWDGLGLVSYCLVLYYQSTKAYGAALMTAMTNRIGDVMILIAITYMFSLGSWNFCFNMNEEQLSNWDFKLVMLLLMVAAMTKSAQIPFSAWLPAAMAAPTPVSSLVHSSTLVTAGVYLLIRMNHMLMLSSLGKPLFIISCLTMMYAGISANYENDLKKIIALSTLSQLGLMMSILSLGYPMLAFFHLLTHAMFKALLFMCAGNFIHSMTDNQDIRFMSGLGFILPVTSACFITANMALCGLPFLAGFYSKDLILETFLQYNYNYLGGLIYYLSTGLTMSYTIRLILIIMNGGYKTSSCYGMGDEGWLMTAPIMMLTFLAIFGGGLLSWLLIEPQLINIPMNQKLLTVMVIMVGGGLGSFISMIKMYSIHHFFSNLWYLPVISTQLIIFKPLSVGMSFLKKSDLGWSEILGPQGLFFFLTSMSKLLETWQTISLKIMLFSAGLIILILMFFS